MKGECVVLLCLIILQLYQKNDTCALIALVLLDAKATPPFYLFGGPSKNGLRHND